MINKENTLLVEKYRPNNLNSFVGNEQLKETIKGQLDKNDIQNFLFYGSAGCGKTTLAKLIVANLDCDWLYINASDERGIETIRDKVSSFASMASMAPLKVIILDEADYLTVQAQASLRYVIEQFSRTTRFILTCNFIERIFEPIQSRCQTLKVTPPNKADIARRLVYICDEENISYNLSDIGEIVKKYYPDIRRMIGAIQSQTLNGALQLNTDTMISSVYMVDVLKELLKTKPKFQVIRQIIADSGVEDFDELYRFLFDKSSEYLPGKEGTAASLINTHLFQRSFRIDQEICVMSLISNLIDNK